MFYHNEVYIIVELTQGVIGNYDSQGISKVNHSPRFRCIISICFYLLYLLWCALFFRVYISDWTALKGRWPLRWLWLFGLSTPGRRSCGLLFLPLQFMIKRFPFRPSLSFGIFYYEFFSAAAAVNLSHPETFGFALGICFVSFCFWHYLWECDIALLLRDRLIRLTSVGQFGFSLGSFDISLALGSQVSEPWCHGSVSCLTFDFCFCFGHSKPACKNENFCSTCTLWNTKSYNAKTTIYMYNRISKK